MDVADERGIPLRRASKASGAAKRITSFPYKNLPTVRRGISVTSRREATRRQGRGGAEGVPSQLDDSFCR